MYTEWQVSKKTPLWNAKCLEGLGKKYYNLQRSSSEVTQPKCPASSCCRLVNDLDCACVRMYFCTILQLALDVYLFGICFEDLGLLEDACVLFVLPVFSAPLPSSAFIGCQGHVGGLGVRLLILVYVRAMSL